MRKSNKGFTLIELVVVIAIMAVMTGVVVPSLMTYTESTRADKDTSHMEELVTAIEMAMTDQNIYEDLLVYALEDNYSCYADNNPATNIQANMVEDYNIGNAEGVVDTTVDMWHYNDEARNTSKAAYVPAGRMSGVTITFAHTFTGETKDIVIGDALINNMSTATKKNNSVKLSELSTDGTTYLYNNLKRTVSDRITTESQKYRHCEYTVFIRMLPQNVDYDKYANLTVAVYGQWNGNNLGDKARRNPANETNGDDSITPVAPGTPEAPVPVAPGNNSEVQKPQTPRENPVFVAPTINQLVYNKTQQNLVQSGSTDHGTMYYKLGDGTWKTTIPTAINAGEYKVSYYVKGDAEHYDSEVGVLDCKIAQATPKITTAPKNQTIKENGTAIELISPKGVAEGGTFYYKLATAQEWSTTIPTATQPGTYPVQYYVRGADANYHDLEPVTVLVHIQGKPGVTYEPVGAKNLVYDGNSHELLESHGQSSTGTFMYSINDSTFTENYPTGIAAGEYKITWYVKSNKEFLDDTEKKTLTVTIGKGTPSATGIQAVNGLVYDKTSHTLVTAGQSSTGTKIEYSLDNQNWQDTPPAAVNAGSYTVYYQIKGNENWNDVPSRNISVSIAKRKPSVSVEGVRVNYSSDAITLVSGETDSDAPLQYSVTGAWSTTPPKGIAPDTYVVKYKADATANYEAVPEQSVTSYIIGNLRVIPTDGVSTYNGTDTNGNASIKVLWNDQTVNSHSYQLKWGEEPGKYNLTTMPTFTDAGTHTAYYQITSEHFTTVTGSIQIVINKAVNNLTVATYSGATTINSSGETTITNPSGGKLSVSSDNENICTAEVITNTNAKAVGILLKYYGKGHGQARLTITSEATNNYEAATKYYSVTVSESLVFIDLDGGTINGESEGLVYGSNEGASQEQEWTTKGLYEFTANYSGFYYIEAWGAQGGWDAGSSGGGGGYLMSYIYLDKGQTIYVAVGGQGGSSASLAEGGWNGGAHAGVYGSSGGGGGATAVYLTKRGDGLLTDYPNYKNDIIMVAGGGGGGSVSTAGTGGTVLYQYTADNQTFPGAVINDADVSILNGMFANGTALTGTELVRPNDGGGGGGGWVGGKNGLDADPPTNSGGGASFINTLLKCVPLKLDSSGTYRSTTQNVAFDGKCKITYETKSAGIETPTKEGHEFIGWVNDSGKLIENELTGTTLFEFAQNQQSKLTAKWRCLNPETCTDPKCNKNQ